MTVRIRPYRKKRKDGSPVGGWEADISVMLPDGTEHRERAKAPGATKTVALEWAKARELHLVRHGLPKEEPKPEKPIPTLE